MMVSILSPELCTAVLIAAFALPLAFAIWRAVHSAGSWWRKVLSGVGHYLVIVVAQALLIVGVFLGMNREYGFFASWSDLFVEADPAAPIHDLVPIRRTKVKDIPISKDNPHPNGYLTGLTMPGTDPQYGHVPVWLPPQYFEKSAQGTRFPVLYYIGGLNDTGDHANVSMDLITPAQDLVTSRKINPFAIVFLPGRIRRGIDSECLDVGPVRHESWIMKTVLPRIESRYRVGHERGSRFIGGWSSGGYCSVNLATKYPKSFNAGIGIGGYYHPTFEGQILASVSQPLIDANSVMRRVHDNRIDRSVRFLSVLNRSDVQSWGPEKGTVISNGQIGPDAGQFYRLANGRKQFPFIVLNGGGHRGAVYMPYVQQCLEWLGQFGL
ncbi:alpha/beta hydrolase-fold protein [Cutibacterium equinum]|uniref:Alpha/beta hydrolase-fold protein n=1 Tax=Cutibacterium equinum TaxID=3016342 RepID=A0ABY7QVW6_9ACTN|nr:alpha/beta hydrolase-fold protein [Cutibacterium equinum]WCC79213.1 alpha/beta hydrolase-fold protein [Cutibacterium equinum]